MPKPSMMDPADDPTVRYTPLELNGVTYRLAFDFNALARAEAVAGINLLQGLNLTIANAQQFRAVLWAALLKAQPKMTIDEAGALLQPGAFEAISQALMESFTASMPDRSPENPPKPDEEPAV